MIAIIATAIACFVVGGILSYVLFRYVLKSKYDSVLKDAETEAEVIKKNKLLEVKEKFLNKKADLEKEVALRNQKIQQAENKLKQREMVLSQRQEEIQRKKLEAEAVKENLEAQLVIVDKGRTRQTATSGNRKTGSNLRSVCRRSKRTSGRITEGRS